METPAGGETDGRSSLQPSYLQLGHFAQSQQMHCAHPHTPVVQQSQHTFADADTDEVNGDAATAISAEAINRNDFMIFLLFKD